MLLQKMIKQNGTNKRDIKQEHALLAWRETNGNITKLCFKAGINRKTFYEWLKNPDFADQIWEQEQKLNDDIKDQLVQQALKGNLRAIIYYLEHKHPEFIHKGEIVSYSPPIPILGGASQQEPMGIEFVSYNDKGLET